MAIPHRGQFLTGSYASPSLPRALVLIANDRGCSRHIPALCILAGDLRDAGYATLMLDVVTHGEEEVAGVAAHQRADTGLLASRIDAARDFLAKPGEPQLAVVLLGLGSAAPAALLSASASPSGVAAVITCGPRPDLACPTIERVSAPTLLISPTSRSEDVAAQLRASGHLRGERDVVLLDGARDPLGRSVQLGRTVLKFLSSLRVPHAA